MKTNIITTMGMVTLAAAALIMTGCDDAPSGRSKQRQTSNSDAVAVEPGPGKEFPPIIVAVSPDVPAAAVTELRGQAKKLVATLVGPAAAGTHIEWWDGRDPNAKAVLTVGDDPAKIRGRKLAGPVKQLGGFLSACGKGDGKGRLHFPSLCQTLAQRGMAVGTHVIVVGGALHLEEGADKYFSMDDGRVPLDGLFFKDQQESLYSVKGREQTLSGVVFHWAYLSRTPFVDDGFRQRVQDCWAKYVTLQGGTLADFQPSVSTAFSAAFAGRSKGVPAPKADPTAPAVMQKIIKEIREVNGKVSDEAEADQWQKQDGEKTSAIGDKATGTVALGDDVRREVQQQAKPVLPVRQKADTSTAKVDKHGNKLGSTNDLVADGSCTGRIGIINFYIDDNFDARKVVPPLEKKGFTVEKLTVPLVGIAEFKAKLAKLSQVWIFSSIKDRLPHDHAEALADACRSGKLALYIAGDNDPWHTEADLLLGLMFPGARMSGNDRGGQKVYVRAASTSGTASGFNGAELIFAGITSLYEGDTVSAITCVGELRPVLWGTQRHPVIAVSSASKMRVVVDAGFTRWFPQNFDTAGTERLAVNCAGFLAGVASDAQDDLVAR